jgi:DNA-directed RNA polymerase specialized sigma24 family protein
VSGDSDDFGDWVASTGPGLIRFGYLVSGDQQAAEGLAREALARVRQRWRRLADRGNPDAYARAIMVSQLRSWQRKRSPAGAATAGMATWSDGATDLMPLWSVILGLPERMRAAVVLRFYEDLDDDAIGQVLSCPAGTVREHIREALDRIGAHPAAGPFVPVERP